jgi:hypothetical protein
MSTEQNNSKKIEDVLESLGGMSRAKAPDFFYTRLKARMDGEMELAGGPIGRLLTRPALALTLAVIILVMNITVIMQLWNQDNTLPVDNPSAVAAVDYNAGTYPVYDENPVEP